MNLIHIPTTPAARGKKEDWTPTIVPETTNLSPPSKDCNFKIDKFFTDQHLARCNIKVMPFYQFLVIFRIELPIGIKRGLVPNILVSLYWYRGSARQLAPHWCWIKGTPSTLSNSVVEIVPYKKKRIIYLAGVYRWCLFVISSVYKLTFLSQDGFSTDGS